MKLGLSRQRDVIDTLDEGVRFDAILSRLELSSPGGLSESEKVLVRSKAFSSLSSEMCENELNVIPEGASGNTESNLESKLLYC